MIKKKTTRRSLKKEILAPDATTDLPPSLMDNSEIKSAPNSYERLPWTLGLVALALVVLFLTHKSWLVVAMVNNQPIFSWDFNSAMANRFGKQTLEGMISESLINEEAKKAEVSVTQAEVDAKEAQLLKSFGADVKLDDILKYQGMTREDFDKQMRIQLLVQKIMEKDIKLSDKDVDDFIASNGATLTATEPAQLREEAKQALLDQKVSSGAQAWFTAIRAKAKIVRFF